MLALLSDAAVYGVSSMMTRLIGVLLIPVLTDYLTLREYGVVSMLTIVTSLFQPLGRLGITNAIFRRFNQEKDEHARQRVLGTAFISVVVTSLFVLAVAMAFAGPISVFIVGDKSAVGLVRISLWTSVATTVGTVPFVVLRATRRVKAAAAVNVLKTLLTMVAIIWLVVSWDQGVWGVVIGTLVGEVSFALVLIGITMPAMTAGFDWATWKRMASYGLPFVPHHLQAVGLDLFGLYMVGEMLGLGAAGLYGLATRFATPVTFIVNAVQASWVPYKFQIHSEDADSKPFFQSTFTYYVATLSYLWVGVALWGPDALRLLATSAEYYDAAHLIWAVALIPVAQGLYFMSSTGLELTDDTRPLPLVSFVGLMTVVGTGFVFIRPLDLGALGAALATAVGWLAMSAVVYALSQRRFAIAYDWPTIVAFAVMAALFVIVGGMVVQPLPVLPRLALITAMSLAYPAIGLVFLLRSRDERDRMLHLLSKFRLMPSDR
ncbi:MAG: lipopolysaccharide biosynthesis protein [Pirellulales bacterium]